MWSYQFPCLHPPSLVRSLDDSPVFGLVASSVLFPPNPDLHWSGFLSLIIFLLELIIRLRFFFALCALGFLYARYCSLAMSCSPGSRIFKSGFWARVLGNWGHPEWKPRPQRGLPPGRPGLRGPGSIWRSLARQPGHTHTHMCACSHTAENLGRSCFNFRCHALPCHFKIWNFIFTTHSCFYLQLLMRQGPGSVLSL